jgi:hypothetical protein
MKTAILLSALSATALPASADWQGTVWGMSRKEVDKTLQRIPHTKDGSFNYTTGNIEFDLGLALFDETGGLVDIGMRLKNMEQCEELFGVYRSIYGSPVSDEKRPFDDFGNVTEQHHTEWHDASHNNKITINSRKSLDGPIITCAVNYEPLKPLPEPKLARRTLNPAPGGL